TANNGDVSALSAGVPIFEQGLDGEAARSRRRESHDRDFVILPRMEDQLAGIDDRRREDHGVRCRVMTYVGNGREWWRGRQVPEVDTGGVERVTEQREGARSTVGFVPISPDAVRVTGRREVGGSIVDRGGSVSDLRSQGQRHGQAEGQNRDHHTTKAGRTTLGQYPRSNWRANGVSPCLPVRALPRSKSQLGWRASIGDPRGAVNCSYFLQRPSSSR